MPVSTMKNPSLQDLIKVAMEGSAQKIDVSAEAARQLGNAGVDPPNEEEKTAAEEIDVPDVEYIDKLAEGCFYLAKEMDPKVANVDFPGTENDLGPGKGPNASDVSAAQADGDNPAEAGQMGKAIDKDVPPINPPTQKDPTRSAGPDNQMESNDSMMHPEQPTEPISNEKTTLTNDSVKASSAYWSNMITLGLAKVGQVEDGSLQIVDLTKEAFGGGKGDPLTGGLPTAWKPGKDPQVAAKQKSRAASLKRSTERVESAKQKAKEYKPSGGYTPKAPSVRSKGYNLPTGATGVRGTTSKLTTKMGQAPSSVGQNLPPPPPPPEPAQRATRTLGTPKADPKAEKTGSILESNLAALGLVDLAKQAEDAISPAQISSGKADAVGAEPPKGAAPSEEGIPSEPSDVSSQKSMISSNDSAINYTKGQAKKDPKSDLSDILSQPALSSAHDNVLQKVLSNTGKAGVKISSAMEAAVKKMAQSGIQMGKPGAGGGQRKATPRGSTGGKIPEPVGRSSGVPSLGLPGPTRAPKL